MSYRVTPHNAGWNAMLVGLSVVVVLPLYWMVVASVSPSGTALAPQATDVDRAAITWEHYAELFRRLNMGRFFVNSLIVALTTTIAALILNSMAGYAFAKLRFAGREYLFRGLVCILVIPTQVAMLPLFILLKHLHLINSYWALILPASASAYGVFLVRQYALSIPNSIIDAARLDGASEMRLFVQVVAPMLRPILTALGIFVFLASWNDFMWPLIVLTGNDSYTLPVALAVLSGEHVQDVELMMAASVVTTAPVAILFVLFQRHLVTGIVVGSIKE